MFAGGALQVTQSAHLSDQARPQPYMAAIYKMAESVFFPQHIQELMSYLGYTDPSSIKFSYQEALQLKLRRELTQAEGKGKGGQPFLQFYDFVFTIDEVCQKLANLKDTLDRSIQSMGDIGANSLKQQIMANNWHPWGLNDGAAVQTLMNSMDENERRRTVGMRLGEPSGQIFMDQGEDDQHVPYLADNVPNPQDYNPADGRRLRKKTTYERSVDEAAILSFPILNDIVALSQGLFRIYTVEANKLQAPTLEDDATEGVYNEAHSVIQANDWFRILMVSHIDGSKVPHLTTDSPILKLQSKRFLQKVSATRIPAGSWINSFVNSAIGVNMDTSILQAKVTDVRAYPSNWIGRVFNREVKDPDMAERMFGWKGKVDAHRLPPEGGAIARFLFAIPGKFQMTHSAPNASNEEVLTKVSKGKVEISRPTWQWWWPSRTNNEEDEKQRNADHLSLLEAYPAQWDSGLYLKTKSERGTYLTNIQPTATTSFSHPIKSSNSKECKIVFNLDGKKRTVAAAVAANPSGDAIANVFNYVNLNDPATPPTRAMEVSMAMIHDEMASLDHPIAVCPDLASAFKTSGLNVSLFDKYAEIQAKYQSALKLTQLGTNTGGALDLGGAQANLAQPLRCGEGFEPRYVNSKNEPLTQAQAVRVEADGSEWLTPLVDIGKSSCVPKVAAVKSMQIQSLSTMPSMFNANAANRSG